MDASCNPSIASEVHARHKRPHRLALLATSPVATGEAKQEEPRKGTETSPSVTDTSRNMSFQNRIPVRGRKQVDVLMCGLSVLNHFKTISP